MMAFLRSMRFIFFLIPIIIAAKFPHDSSESVAPVSNFDSDLEYQLMDVEDYESGYSTTEGPYMEYLTKRSNDEELAEEESTEEILQEAVTASDHFAGRRSNRHKRMDSQNRSLSDLFAETHSANKFDFERCEDLLAKDELRHHIVVHTRNFYVSSSDDKNMIVDPLTGEEKSNTFTWEEAQDLCRSHCKEILTLDSRDKVSVAYVVIESDSLLGIWTSGRRCDFPGCENRADVREDGWFWSTTGQEIHKEMSDGRRDWAKTGPEGPQPDNAEFAIRGVNESCLALRQGVGEKGLKQHDLSCNHKLHVICEEPREMHELRNEQLPVNN